MIQNLVKSHDNRFVGNTSYIRDKQTKHQCDQVFILKNIFSIIWYIEDLHLQLLLCIRKALPVLKKVLLFWEGLWGGAESCFVLSKWKGWPHYLIARIAGIFKAFDVFLNMLFHVTCSVWSVPTIFAVIPVNPFFNHWFIFFHRNRFNEWH